MIPASGASSRTLTSIAARTARVAVVVSRYNASITDKLREGALRAWSARHASRPGGELLVIDAPGAFELTALSSAAAETGEFAGVVALGCLIKGDTKHDQYIASAVAHGLTQVTVRTGVPVAFGVITAENARQARERAGGRKGNKGEEAMNALLDTLASLEALQGRAAHSTDMNTPRPRPDKAAKRQRTRKRN